MKICFSTSKNPIEIILPCCSGSNASVHLFAGGRVLLRHYPVWDHCQDPGWSWFPSPHRGDRSPPSTAATASTAAATFPPQTRHTLHWCHCTLAVENNCWYTATTPTVIKEPEHWFMNVDILWPQNHLVSLCNCLYPMMYTFSKFSCCRVCYLKRNSSESPWLIMESQDILSDLHNCIRSKVNLVSTAMVSHDKHRQTLLSVPHPSFLLPCFPSHSCSSFPAHQNFGLDYHTFQHMVGDCPSDFLQLAFNCCNVSPWPPPLRHQWRVAACLSFVNFSLLSNPCVLQARKM